MRVVGVAGETNGHSLGLARLDLVYRGIATRLHDAQNIVLANTLGTMFIYELWFL